MVDRFDPELIYEPYSNGDPLPGMSSHPKGEYVYHDAYQELLDKYDELVAALGDLWREA